MFSCEFCEIFKDIFFYRTLPVIASETLWKRTDIRGLRKDTFSHLLTSLSPLLTSSFKNNYQLKKWSSLFPTLKSQSSYFKHYFKRIYYSAGNIDVLQFI